MTGEPLFVERPCVIGMLPHGVRELPEGSFLGSQCNAPQDGGLSFSPAGAHGCALFVERMDAGRKVVCYRNAPSRGSGAS